MEQLQEETKRESKDRNKILNKHQKEYNDCLKEIDGIISMKARKELDEENYKRRMSFLTKEKARVYELLQETENRVNAQLEVAEKSSLLPEMPKKNLKLATQRSKK
ncbi:hypothetical protein J7L36_01760 [bacterium]|nr:hypothetical protein [bacterium]